MCYDIRVYIAEWLVADVAVGGVRLCRQHTTV